MTMFSRLKLLLGLVLVIVLVGALTIALNARLSTVRAVSSTLVADDFPIGTDYSGLVTKQYVAVGDVVAAGDPMFEIQSTSLARDIANGLVSRQRSPLEITNSDTIVLAATRPGTVREVMYKEGAFVPANAVVANLVESGSLYVEARFRLTAADYALIRPDSMVTVTLPDDSTLEASVIDVSVQRAGTSNETWVKALPSGLSNDRLFAVGTPVDATMRLRDDALVRTIADAVSGLLTPRNP